MNLPNKLTLLRILLIPVFMVVLYWGFPGAGKCGEDRRLCGSAAGTNLFPVRRGCRGTPAASKPPFSFRLRRKEKALFDGVKRKDAGGGISGSA